MGESDDAVALPAPVAVRATLAQQLCRRVLNSMHAVDASASITSVSRWDHDNATLVRIRASEAHEGAPHGVVAALRQHWPLARVSLVENLVEGTTEAQMLVPSTDEQRMLARDQAFELNGARRARAFAKAVALAALLSFVVLVTSSVTATAAS